MELRQCQNGVWIICTFIDLKPAGFYVIKGGNERRNKTVIVGLFHILGNDHIFFRKKRNQFFAINMFFESVKFSIQNHPRRTLTDQISGWIRKINLLSLVKYGWI